MAEWGVGTKNVPGIKPRLDIFKANILPVYYLSGSMILLLTLKGYLLNLLDTWIS